MRGSEAVFCAIGEVDVSLLEAAERLPKSVAVRRRMRIAAALCAAAAAALCLVILPRALRTDEMPMLTVSTHSDGMGYASWSVDDAERAILQNPATDARIQKLPVYRSPLSQGKLGNLLGVELDAMRRALDSVADALGIAEGTRVYSDNAPSPESIERTRAVIEGGGETLSEGYFDPTQLFCEDGDYKIQINAALEAYITFLTPQAATEEALLSLAARFGIEDPTVVWKNEEEALLYSEKGSAADRLLAYSLRAITVRVRDGRISHAAVTVSENGTRVGAAYYVGTYPLITEEEARARLAAGGYLAGYIEKPLAAASAIGWEIVYRTGLYTPYYMPFYRFYMPLPDGDVTAYDVPALRAEFYDTETRSHFNMG